jgi:hypothetical protein
VKEIGEEAFEGCYRLVEVVNKSPDLTLTKGAEDNGAIGKYALTVYQGDYYFTSKITNDNGFLVYSLGQKKILVGYLGEQTELTIPSYITKINEYAFYDCDKITSVAMSTGVTVIGDNAFALCRSLQKITMSSSVEKIGAEAFSYCTSLNSVNIPDSVDTIGYRVFYECTSLNSVNIPDKVTAIGLYSFYNCSNLERVTIGKNVVNIGFYAFYGCSALKSVVIPDSVCSIGSGAFALCPALSEARFENTLGWNVDGESLAVEHIENTQTAAEYLKDLYSSRTWTKS